MSAIGVHFLQFELSKHDSRNNLVLRIRDTLQGVSAADAFAKFVNFSSRPQWDFMCKYVGTPITVSGCNFCLMPTAAQKSVLVTVCIQLYQVLLDIPGNQLHVTASWAAGALSGNFLCIR